MPRKLKPFYILTGYSGSGKTTALRCFEELGYYCVDNLPAALLNDFVKLLTNNPSIEKVAVVIDARGKEFMTTLQNDVDLLKNIYNLNILFFDCDLNSVTKRFKASRLKHPISLNGSIRNGYNLEKEILLELRQQANLIINTSHINVHAHRSVVQKYIMREEKNLFEVSFISFGFKHGLPQEADVVIDVRFLKNPFFEPKLKNKTGLQKSVQNYVLADKETDIFLKKTQSYLDYLVKRYKEEGKSYVKIAIGCTGGQHRSVTIVESLNSFFKKRPKLIVQSEHRDVN